MPKRYLLIGNWKMYFPYLKATTWGLNHKQELDELMQSTSHTIVLCPSFEALFSLIKLFDETSIAIGAQDCSAYQPGGYTAQVLAQSLAEIGCSYCLVAHSETRQWYTPSNEIITEKIKRCIEHNLTPILCVGETHEEYQAQKTLDKLEQQLEPVISNLKPPKRIRLLIAYEPIWSIGTGNIPKNKELEKVFDFIANIVKPYDTLETILLYGGSVNHQTIQDIKKVGQIEGFLIGKASTDFQELKKTVLSI